MDLGELLRGNNGKKLSFGVIDEQFVAKKPRTEETLDWMAVRADFSYVIGSDLQER